MTPIQGLTDPTPPPEHTTTKKKEAQSLLFHERDADSLIRAPPGTTPHAAIGPEGKEANETEASVFNAASGHAHSEGTRVPWKQQTSSRPPKKQQQRQKDHPLHQAAHSQIDEENLTGVGMEEQEIPRRNTIHTENVDSDKKNPRRRGHRQRG